MGAELAREFSVARDVFQEADDALGEKLSALCWEGPEDELTLTRNTQPAILTNSIAVFRTLVAEKGLTFDLAAGHSLGEWTALVAADALGFADAIRLVRLRGQAMQDAVAPGEGAMAALMGLEIQATRQLCEEIGDVWPANLNGAGQIVIAGKAAAIEKAIAAAKGKGAKRAVALAVSAPFHCPLMGSAADKLAATLSQTKIAAPKVPVIANVTAAEHGDTRELLVKQVTAPVRWEESVQKLAALGAERGLELGSGSVLAGLVKRIAPSVKVSTIGEPHEVKAYAQG
jgi:[acyl-carrier-protein] S-malonyltransferase